MKYRELYSILENRRLSTPGFRYDDRSGWRNFNASPYINQIRPLWIIVEDSSAGQRIWITQDGPDMEITVCEMDAQGRNGKTLQRISCKTKTELAERLRRLFTQETTVA